MKLFESLRLYGKLLPYEKFRLYSDLPKGLCPGEYERGVILEAAERALEAEIPQLYATQYMRFVRDGDRSEFEKSYFARRNMLRALTMGEYLEKKGRFLDKIINLVWLICEETTWVVPAHNGQEIFEEGKNTLLTRDIREIPRHLDLFAAETGAELANTLYYLRDELDGVTPSVTARMEYQLENRILTPFEKYHFWWEGYHGGLLNNWNPWILSNILFVIGVLEKDDLRREGLCEKALTMLDRFVASYSPDGGCDEGPSYWTAAAACLYDCLEILYDLTGGKVNLLQSDLVNNMCDYFRKAYISGNYVMNFADAPATMNISGEARLLNRMARRVGNQELAAFASYAAYYTGEKQVPYGLGSFEGYRSIRDAMEAIPPYTGGGICTHAEFPGIVVSVNRQYADYNKGFYFAIKGGTNGESHNHNDVGSFVLYRDGKPVICDMGVGTYCRKTFSEERYTIPSMTSAYHSLPEIGGATQLPGIEYASREAVFSPEGLSVEIAGAYPADCGLASLRRTGKLQDGKVTITDTLSLSEEKEIIFNLICFDRPELLPSGEAKLGDTLLTFDKRLTAEVEDFIFDDIRFNRTWNRDRMYRLRLKATVKEGEFTVVFS